MINTIDVTSIINDSFILILGILLALLVDISLAIIKTTQQTKTELNLIKRTELKLLFDDIVRNKKTYETHDINPSRDMIIKTVNDFFRKEDELNYIYSSYKIYFLPNSRFEELNIDVVAAYSKCIKSPLKKDASQNDIKQYEKEYVDTQAFIAMEACDELLKVVTKELYKLTKR